MADDLLEAAAAGAQVGAGRIEAGHRVGAPRFRLGDVGARHLADREAVLRGLQLARQHVDVVLVEADELLVAHHVHVGGDRLQQHLALDVAQVLALGAHGRFGVVDGVIGAKPAEDRLDALDGVAARLGHAVEERGRTLVVALPADVGFAGDGRAVSRHGARDLLVGAAGKGALGVEARVITVGRRQRLEQALRLCRHRDDPQAEHKPRGNSPTRRPRARQVRRPKRRRPPHRLSG